MNTLREAVASSSKIDPIARRIFMERLAALVAAAEVGLRSTEGLEGRRGSAA